MKDSNGSVAIAESLAVQNMGKWQLEFDTPLHVKFLATDGDVKNGKAFRLGQASAKIPPGNRAISLEVICHETSCGVDVARLKAICADIRLVLKHCHEETLGKTEEEALKNCKRYKYHLRQILNHHRGDCVGCDKAWCRHRQIQLEYPELSVAEQRKRCTTERTRRKMLDSTPSLILTINHDT